MQKNNRTILFLAPYPFGQAPSQRFRLEQYMEILTLEGHEVSFHSFLVQRGWKVLLKRGNFIQKSTAIVGEFLLWLALLIGPVHSAVYDFYDAIWLPNNSKESRFAVSQKLHSKGMRVAIHDICLSFQ
jgi:hypothetical protein